MKSANLLLVTLSNVGDVILTTPVISALRRTYPEAHLTVVVGPRARCVLEGSRLIDKLVTYDKKLGWRGKIDFIFELRQRRYDLVIDLRNTAIPFLVSAKKTSLLWGRPNVQKMRDKHLALAQKAGLLIDGANSFDFFSDAEAESLRSKFSADGSDISKNKYFVVAPVAASSVKTWKLSGYQEVVRELLKMTNHSVVIVGDQGAVESGNVLSAMAPSRVFNAAGKTTMRELGALISRSALVLTNDSAVMHLGHELNRPVAAIFGPTDFEAYGRTGPHFKIIREAVSCSPCRAAQCRFDRQHCFEDLSSQRVLEVCQELLHAAVS